MKRFLSLTLFCLIVVLKSYGQSVGVSIGADQFNDREEKIRMSILFGYELSEALNMEVLYSKYASSFFENHKAGAQLKYKIPPKSDLPYNFVLGFGVMSHFGGSYATKGLNSGSWPALPYFCDKDKAVGYYGIVGFELHHKNWTLPFEFQIGKYHVYGNAVGDEDVLSCPEGLDYLDISNIGYGSFSIGINYSFSDFLKKK
jgi:hypothetical protein